MASDAPQGSDLQVGARFDRGHFVPGAVMNLFRRVQSITGHVAKRPRERRQNMDPSGQTLGGVNVRADIQPKITWDPDVDTLVPLRAHHCGLYSFGGAIATGVYPLTLRPKEPTDAAPGFYVDSMDFEIDDGDGYPLALFEAAMQDLEIKVVDGKITSVTESWMACLDTYVSEASTLKTAGTYTAKPTLIGHFNPTLVGNVPLRAKATAGAGAGYDLQAKFALARTVSGTVTTNGTTALVGTLTHFDTELAVGDSLYITGEGPRQVAAIADATHLTLTAAATTTAAGLTFGAARYAGAAINVSFNVPVRVVLGDGSRAGISRYDDLWMIFPSGGGTISANDEYSFTTPRTTATATYSGRNPLHSAGLEVTLDGVVFGGVPGVPGFHDVTLKLTRPRKQNFAGGKYASGIQRNGLWLVTISFNRDRTDRVALEKLINAQSIAVVLSMYGDTFAGTNIDELWRFTMPNCEVADDVRDVTTPNVLPEKIDLNAVRGSDGTPIFTELIYTSVSALS
ncbi:MAG TPA: hypothetical protein VLC46_16420 [Thermoanaerobaculia bacterium]|jgi:hypothetical protein|nr:hypothetical protein [Thermoanaerobaculia bacterium]